jgi:hypothetical protein
MNNLSGLAWYDGALFCGARQCMARQGKASTVAELGSLGRGVARLAAERQGKASTGAGHARALCGSAGRGLSRHGAK